MNNKKKYLSIITGFSHLDSTFLTHNLFFEKLSKNFEKIFIINDENLKFFPQLARLVYRQHRSWKESFKEISELPDNFVLFDPKDSKDFSKFLQDKTLLVINNFNRHLFSIKLHLLLKKHKINQVIISNLGSQGGFDVAYIGHFFRFLFFHLNQTFSKKLLVLLSNLGIVSKVDIQFISNKEIVERVEKSFLYKKNLLFTKKLILVNSRTYDIYLEKKIPISEDYIVHLDASLDYIHETQLRGLLDEEIKDRHYYYLEKFLKKLSNEFKKKVLVCIHPSYHLKEHQGYFKDFKVLKYKTRECIYKSFLVTNFDSGAIGDAIFLKKKILGFISEFMTKNEIVHAQNYAKKVGYLKLNIEKDYLFDKEKILFQMNKNISNYEKYTANFHCFEANKSGSDKIIKIIKDRFF
jgi:hypothetical protein